MRETDQVLDRGGVDDHERVAEADGAGVHGGRLRDEVLRPTMSKLFDIYRDEWGNQISRFTGGRIKSLGALPIESSDPES